MTQATNIINTDYLTGFQYKNSVLQFFPHAEGYVNATQNGTSYTFNYVYNYTDHLGNIRLSYSLDPSTNVLKIIEENHYYPFGLKHTGYNSDQMMYVKEASVLKIKPKPPLFNTSYNYKYNGKELQDELGLNMYDYGARNYDPALGRWMNIDPLAEVSRRWSPYTYCYNNPIKFIDPDGMLAVYDWDAHDSGRKGVYKDGDKEVSFEAALSSYGIDPPKIISRKDWKAKAPITKDREWSKINSNLSVYYNTITVHHSGNESNSMTIKELQNKEQQAGYADIPYHFAIDGEGNIYEGRPIDIMGAHVKGANTGNIGIVLLADLDSQDKGLNIFKKSVEKIAGDGTASSEMIQSLFNLTQYLKSTYGIQYFGGHNEVLSGRNCPGDMGMEWVENIRRSFKMQKPVKK